MYYILTSDLEDYDGDAILSGKSDYLNRIACSFREGIALPFDDIDTPILFEPDRNTIHGKMTDKLNIIDISGPVLSLKARTIFEKVNINSIEYYQLIIVDKTSPEIPNNKNSEDQTEKKSVEYTNYFIANAVGLVDCVNHENSVLEYFYPPELRNQPEETEEEKKNNPFADENPNDIDFITKLVLDENKIDPSLKVFRLKDKPDLLVFHESIVKEIRKEKLSGFVFVPVEEYTDVIPDDDEVKENIAEKEEPAKSKVTDQQKPLPVQTSQPEEQKEKKKGRFNFFSE